MTPPKRMPDRYGPHSSGCQDPAGQPPPCVSAGSGPQAGEPPDGHHLPGQAALKGMTLLKRNHLLWAAAAVVLCVVALASAAENANVPPAAVSGRLVDGFRLLTVEDDRQPVHFRVYRGDYLKFAYDASLEEPVLDIPALSIRQRLTADPHQAPYVKMKATGIFAFTLGPVTGRIEVVDYQQVHYREISSREAVRLIETRQPLILDVRTPGEFAQGHLHNARLIPVQDLERRLSEMALYQDRDILVYCATGNRSTVAAKILNDNGFKRIANLRHGIVQWMRERRPVVR